MSPDYLQSLLDIPGIRADFIKRIPEIAFDRAKFLARVERTPLGA